MPVGVLTGLEFEAHLFDIFCGAKDPPIIRCLGPRGPDSTKAIKELISLGCDSLLSFGIAGGLRPGAEIGDLMIANRVICRTDKRSFETDPNWRKALLGKLGTSFSVGEWTCIGAETMIGEPREKKALFDDMAGAFVDMESHLVARAAYESGLPFAVLRVICDTSEMRIPPWVLSSISANGVIKYSLLILQAFMNLKDWPNLYALKSGSAQARSVLKNAVIHLGPNLGRTVI